MARQQAADIDDQTMRVTFQGETFAIAPLRPESSKFWRKAALGRWEADTFSFIRRQVTKDTTFVDVGAWIGPMSLYASRLAGRVLSFEPDPVAYRELEANLRLNAQNAAIYNAGVDTAEGHLVLYAPNGLGRSITSSFAAEGAEEIRVPTMTFARISAAIGKAHDVAVKVDIEGHEYKVADDLVTFVRRHHAALHISVHPRTFYENARLRAGRYAARRATLAATAALLENLGTLGALKLSDTGARLGRTTLFRYVFLRTRVRNFSVEVVFRAEASDLNVASA